MHRTIRGMTDYAPTLIPSIRYDDAEAAMGFLTGALGFTEVMTSRAEDGTIAHAELRWGTGMVMIGQHRDGDGERFTDKGSFPGIYVVVDDADGACERARAAGATITQEPMDTDYGSRDFGVADPEGNVWWFGTYQPTAG